MRQRLEGLLQQKVGSGSAVGFSGRAPARCLSATVYGIQTPRLCASPRKLSAADAFPCNPPTQCVQAEAQAQLAEQLQRRQRAAQRATRLLKQLQAKGPAGCKLPAGMTLEALAADVQLAQVCGCHEISAERLLHAPFTHVSLSMLSAALPSSHASGQGGHARHAGGAACSGCRAPAALLAAAGGKRGRREAAGGRGHLRLPPPLSSTLCTQRSVRQPQQGRQPAGIQRWRGGWAAERVPQPGSNGEEPRGQPAGELCGQRAISGGSGSGGRQPRLCTIPCCADRAAAAVIV